MFDTFYQYISSFLLCTKVSIDILCMFPLYKLICILILPVITSLLNIHVNNLFVNQVDNIFTCIIFKTLYDYTTWFIQNNMFYGQVYIMNDNLLLRLNMAKLHCGVPIPGKNQKQHKDLLDDQSKLRDFLFVLPMIWSSIISFSISIYKMDTSEIYPVKTIFALVCVIMCGILSYMTDSSVYEKTKPNSKSITKFTESQYVKMKLSMGCIIDTEFEKQKRQKIEKQYNLKKYLMLVINIIITYISLLSKNIGQLHAFGNISWMIGYIANNIKSLQYYSYVKEFIDFVKCLESYKLNANNTESISIIDKVEFVNASFGYYGDDLMNNPNKIQKIFNLNYIFKKGVLYYLEAPNGVGKSTMLKMFTSNLFSGDIYFGKTNRKYLSFDDISSNVFHIVQASEFTPKFSQEEIKAYKNRDLWLEKQLGLTDLFEKDTVEMSGGQKKRMFIYIVLTSNAPILLLDEILSELSTEDTADVPEGGGWLSRVINTLISWHGRNNKIMILVGHGLIDLIPQKKNVLKLKLKNDDYQTKLFIN